MIYFIRHDDYFERLKKSYVKVGYTNRPDVEKRLKELQVGNPRCLNVYLTADGGKDEETYLKKALKTHRVQGEWFNLNESSEGIILSWLNKKTRGEIATGLVA